VLVGEVFRDETQGSHVVVVRGAVPALSAAGSPVHLQFTREAWDEMAGMIDENFAQMLIVGWFHSHPHMGAFMSSTDRASQRAFYNRPWSLALVVDPVTRQTAWFAGGRSRSLHPRHVVEYEPRDLLSGAPHQSPNLKEYSAEMPGVPAWHWLLPIGMLVAASALGGWLVTRSRPPTGMS